MVGRRPSSACAWSQHPVSLGPPGIISACALSCLCQPLGLAGPHPLPLSLQSPYGLLWTPLPTQSPFPKSSPSVPGRVLLCGRAFPLVLLLNLCPSSFLLDRASSSLRTHRFEPCVIRPCSPFLPLSQLTSDPLALPRSVHCLSPQHRVMVCDDLSSHRDDLPGLCPRAFLSCFPLVTWSSIRHQPLTALVIL